MSNDHATQLHLRYGIDVLQSALTIPSVTMKCQLTLYFVILILFALFVAAGLYIFFAGDGSFVNGLLPSLVAVAIEGALFVGLFPLFENLLRMRIEHDRRQRLRDALVDLFDTPLNIISLQIDPLMGRVSGSTSLEPEVLRILQESLRSVAEQSQNIDWGIATPVLMHYCSLRLPVIQSLMPVVADIGGEHLLHWYQVIRATDRIASFETGEDMHTLVTGLIGELQRFEDLVIE